MDQVVEQLLEFGLVVADVLSALFKANGLHVCNAFLGVSFAPEDCQCLQLENRVYIVRIHFFFENGFVVAACLTQETDERALWVSEPTPGFEVLESSH